MMDRDSQMWTLVGKETITSWLHENPISNLQQHMCMFIRTTRTLHTIYKIRFEEYTYRSPNINSVPDGFMLLDGTPNH